MYEDTIAWFEANLWAFIYSIAALIIIYAVYKALLNFTTNYAKDHDLEPHVVNIMKLVLRIVAIVVAFTSVFQIFSLPTDLFVGGSALIGAAIGFGSSQTINNITAGFYVLMSRPFKVKDYVKIGDLEGQVEEISINYTSLYTPTFNLMKVPNTQVMSSRVLNMTHEGLIKYTYSVNFDHALTEEKVMKEILEPAIRDFENFCSDARIRCPEVYLDSADRLGKTYKIRFFIPKGEAKMLYALQPEFNQLIMKHFDKARAPTK